MRGSGAQYRPLPFRNVWGMQCRSIWWHAWRLRFLRVVVAVRTSKTRLHRRRRRLRPSIRLRWWSARTWRWLAPRRSRDRSCWRTEPRWTTRAQSAATLPSPCEGSLGHRQSWRRHHSRHDCDCPDPWRRDPQQDRIRHRGDGNRRRLRRQRVLRDLRRAERWNAGWLVRLRTRERRSDCRKRADRSRRAQCCLPFRRQLHSGRSGHRFRHCQQPGTEW